MDRLSAEVKAAGIVQTTFIVLEIACVAGGISDALDLAASARDGQQLASIMRSH